MNKIVWFFRLIKNQQFTTWRKIQILFGLGDSNYEIPQTGNGQFIYALVDPVSLRIFYIGRSNNPGRRYFEHFNEIDGTNKAKRVNRLKRQYHMFYMIILEQCGHEDVREREKYYISKLGGKRRLTNMTE